MKLQIMDTMFEEFPEEWAVSSLRSILAGRINDHVDLECSKKDEPTLINTEDTKTKEQKDKEKEDEDSEEINYETPDTNI